MFQKVKDLDKKAPWGSWLRSWPEVLSGVIFTKDEGQVKMMITRLGAATVA